jgi:hypothetical protein
MSEVFIIVIGGCTTVMCYSIQAYIQWVKEMMIKKENDKMTRVRDLLSLFYWPIYMRLISFDVSRNKDLLYEINTIIKTEIGRAAPKKIVAEPIIRLLRHIESDTFLYPFDITQAFEQRTFELQRQYNDFVFK